MTTHENELEYGDFIVVECYMEEGIRQISTGLKTYNQAVEFQLKKYYKIHNPNSFIIRVIGKSSLRDNIKTNKG